jgi:hypothetical protein
MNRPGRAPGIEIQNFNPREFLARKQRSVDGWKMINAVIPGRPRSGRTRNPEAQAGVSGFRARACARPGMTSGKESTHAPESA